MKKELSFTQCILLVGVVAVTLATSKQKDSPSPVNYGVATNCGNATKNNITITTVGTEITLPVSTWFTDFGMPNTHLDITSNQNTSQEISTGVIRTCSPSKATNNGATMYVYSCNDNGAAACTVTFTAL